MKEIEILDDKKLIEAYGVVIKELKKRNIIRSKNLLGDLGEYYAINYYNNTVGLPKLQYAPIGTQNIDAISINGDRYSIKSTTGKTTGVFYGLGESNISYSEYPKFEFVIILLFNENYTLDKIIEITWEQFIKYRKWHKRVRAWNLSITQKLINDSKIINAKEEGI